MTPEEEKIDAIIRGPVEGMGYRVVRLRIIGTGRRTLQIMAEPLDQTGMTVEGCADISRAISPILDVEDPISAAYMLEVSSPGIDRPLVSREDFDVWQGHEFKINTTDAIDGRRRFRGMLNGFDSEADEVRMTLDGDEIGIPYAAISSSKLVLTDDLISAFENRYGTADNNADHLETVNE